MTIKRILVNAVLLALLVLVIIWCFRTGKAHNIILENVVVSADGIEYQPLEAVFVDLGQKPELMLADDVIVMRAMGSDLITLQVDVVDDDDNVLESRVISFALDEIGEDLRISVPIFYAKAQKK